MKQFTHGFSIIPLSQIKSKYWQYVVFVDNPQILTFLASDPVTLEPEAIEDDNGYYYTYTFSALVKDDDVMKCNGQRAILCLTLSNGSVRYFGDLESAPIISVTPYPDKFLVKSTFYCRDAVII